MKSNSWRISDLAERQHGAVAVWQMRERLGLSGGEIRAAVRRLVRVHHGVYALRDLDELGWYAAAAFALGPDGVVSHRSALMLLELRPFEPHDIHVSVPGNGGRRRGDLVVHRRARMETGTYKGIPVTSPTQSLKDADLAPFELYRALEQAEKHGYPTALPLDAVVRLKQTVRGYTRSDAEAQVLILCEQNGITLPLVNHRLNGVEADFHWPEARLVLEVDGWEFHNERVQFEEDRRRELLHAAHGWQVVRASGSQVMRSPELLLAALTSGSPAPPAGCFPCR